MQFNEVNVTECKLIIRHLFAKIYKYLADLESHLSRKEKLKNYYSNFTMFNRFVIRLKKIYCFVIASFLILFSYYIFTFVSFYQYLSSSVASYSQHRIIWGWAWSSIPGASKSFRWELSLRSHSAYNLSYLDFHVFLVFDSNYDKGPWIYSSWICKIYSYFRKTCLTLSFS